MRRYLPVLTAAATVLLATACDSTPAPDPASAPALAHTAPRASPSAAGLQLPAHAHVLVPETTGSSDLDLKRFAPDQDSYTIYARCTGSGKVTIVDRDRPDLDPSRVSCGGVDTVGLVYSDTKPQALGVRVRGGEATWTVAVVAGAREG
ncbi:hypothetical protein [Streptomyces sp. NPDC013181]|uniref:hypothetical protein n=1 Tax=unclassified Streptomyces TaxID=2593676 RepID=UPI0036742B52